MDTRVVVAESQGNELLAALTAAGWGAISRCCEACVLKAGAVLQEPGMRLTHAVFPASALLSLQQVVDDGEASQVAMIGAQGFLGASLLMGESAPLNRTVVLLGGQAVRLPAHWLEHEFESRGPMLPCLLRQGHALMTEIAQTGACHRRHTLAQRLARWLLQCQDGALEAHLCVTHEVIGCALGVRREGVTEALGRMQREGVLRLAHGRISVLDRPALEQRSCGCYRVVRGAYEQAIGAIDRAASMHQDVDARRHETLGPALVPRRAVSSPGSIGRRDEMARVA